MPNIWPVQSELRTYGYQKDKFNPSARYHLVRVAALPSHSPNNAALAPIVKNQDGVGACGGFAWAEYFYCLALSIGQPVDAYSENWLYNLARWMEGTLSQDAGLSNDDLLTMVAKFGLLIEQYWPWINQLDTAAPSSARQLQAIKYPNFQYFRVDGGVDGIRSAMAAGLPVVTGGPWFREWENITSTGLLPMPTLQSDVAGGHDTLWLDYDDPTRQFYCQNSWGPSFGTGGRFYVPYDAVPIMAQMGGYDVHYATMDKVPVPIPVPPIPAPIPNPIPTPSPTPVPTPSGCKWGKAVASTMNLAFMQQLRGRQGRFYYMNPNS